MSSFESDQPSSQEGRVEDHPTRQRSGAEATGLSSLKVKNGQLQITTLEGQIPQFILDANAAVKLGQIKKAADILNEDAIDEVRKTLQGSQADTTVMLALAKLLFDVDQWTRAEEWYRKICELEPHAFAYNAIAEICLNQNRIAEAAEYHKKALESDPDNEAYWVNYAKALIRAGKRDQGLELLRRRAEEACSDDEGVQSVLLWQLHYVPGATQQMFFEEYERWGETHFPVSLAKTSHSNDPEPSRRLRIAYISPDFRRNVVARSFEPFLDGHDREQFEIFGYGRVARPDEVTERFEKKFDHYRDIRGITVSEAVRAIEDDRIDVLVGIGGHVRDNCLAILASKPAPIQIDYGGINTSGMAQIDYRLTDRVMTPPQMEEFYVEILTDEELITLCKRELPYQTTSFEMLVKRYQNKVFHKTMQMVKNKEDAEDVTQEIFLKVFVKLFSFKGESSFSTWLYSITTNSCLNVLDRRTRQPSWFAIDYSEIKESEKEDEALFAIIHSGLEKKELRQKIETVLDKLSKQDSSILRFRFFEELDYQTITDRLDVKLSATKMRLKRAKENFKDLYNQLETEK